MPGALASTRTDENVGTRPTKAWIDADAPTRIDRAGEDGAGSRRNHSAGGGAAPAGLFARIGSRSSQSQSWFIRTLISAVRSLNAFGVPAAATAFLTGPMIAGCISC